MIQLPTSAEIARAAALLRAGRLVAFPTETVYGLGANALDPEAVARIYAVKRRPATSPLIVHVSSVEMAKSLVADWPEAAELLTRKFWPGPLTLVLPKNSPPKNPLIPDIVTAGLPTVGLRMPAHPIAQALIQAAGVPLAAPSANRFTELSPTTAQHVRQSLGAEVDMILDGGPCQVGIESTVLSLAGLLHADRSLAHQSLDDQSLAGSSLVRPHPILLRPGGISRAQLESVIGPIASSNEAQGNETPGHAIPAGAAHPSPGMHPRHYSPRTSLLLVSNGNLPDQGKGIYLQHAHPPSRSDIQTLKMPDKPALYAAVLYEMLHYADDARADWIAVDRPPNTPAWEAINDRLRRAATKGAVKTPPPNYDA